MKKVVLDIYGADAGTGAMIEGAQAVLDRHPEIGMVLVGDRADIENYGSLEPYGDRLEIIHADDFIRNTDPASCVFNGRETSSMVLALKKLKNDPDCVGLLSPGSTGALMVGSIFRVGLIKGLKMPALSTSLPRIDGKMVCLVDCGANVNCTEKDLLTFGLLGDAYAKVMYRLDSPRVGLMSVGTERTKGNELTLKAYPLLEEANINFIGNMEGSDLIMGKADVVVSDGFSGNVLLKSHETAGQIAMHILKSEMQKSPEPKACMQDAYDPLAYLYDLNVRGGATFLGTNKPVIKMHGVAVARTVVSCTEQLLMLDANGFSEGIKNILS